MVGNSTVSLIALAVSRTGVLRGESAMGHLYRLVVSTAGVNGAAALSRTVWNQPNTAVMVCSIVEEEA